MAQKMACQDTQLDEAVQTMTLLQKKLQIVEKENSCLKNDITEERKMRTTAQEQVKRLNQCLTAVSVEFSKIIPLMGDGVTEAQNLIELKSSERVLMEQLIREKLELFSLNFNRKLNKRIQAQMEMRCEIEKTQKVIEKLDKLFHRKNVTAPEKETVDNPTQTTVVDCDYCEPQHDDEVMECTFPDMSINCQAIYNLNSNDSKLEETVVVGSASASASTSPDLTVTKTELSLSEKYHGEDKSMYCLCGEKFPDKTFLRKHISREQNARWLPCHICRKHFLGPWALTLHNRRDHSIIVKRGKTGCAQCGFTFINKWQLQKHQNICCMSGYPFVKVDRVEYKLGRESYLEDEKDTGNGVERQICQNELEREVRGSVFLLPHHT